MSYAPCTCLPESEADCLPTSSSDTSRLSPSSGTNTLAESCENEQQTDGSLNCQCGKETFGCSIHPNTRGEWIASMRGSLAKILASLENRPDLEKALGRGFTVKSCESLAWYDRDTSSWKTYQRSFLTGWGAYSETWPRWGMTAAGSAYAHPMSALRIGAIDGLPLLNGETFHHTPNTTGMDGGSNSRKALKTRQEWATQNTMDSLPSRGYEAMKRQATNGGRKNRSRPGNLREQIDPLMCQACDDARMEANQNWPTPSATDYKGSGKTFATPQARDYRTGQESRWNDPARSRNLNDQIGGQLNPKWVSWLMGFPTEWALSKD